MKSNNDQNPKNGEAECSNEILDELKSIKEKPINNEPDAEYKGLLEKALNQKIVHRCWLFRFSIFGAILLFVGFILFVIWYRDAFVNSLGKSVALFATFVSSFLGLLHTLVKVVFDDRVFSTPKRYQK